VTRAESLAQPAVSSGGGAVLATGIPHPASAVRPANGACAPVAYFFIPNSCTWQHRIIKQGWDSKMEKAFRWAALTCPKDDWTW